MIRGHAHCKLLRKYSIFQVLHTFCLHHCATVCKMTEHWLKKLWVTVAATSLNTKSTCKLSVIKGLQLHSWWSLVSSQPWPHTPLHHAVQQYKSSQWMAESGWGQNKHVSCHNFQTMKQYVFTLESYPCTIWLWCPVCEWNSHALTFLKTDN